MSPQAITVSVILVCVALPIIYDIFIIKKFGEKASISYVIGFYSREYPIIVAGICIPVGVLIGHFWWPIQTLCKDIIK